MPKSSKKEIIRQIEDLERQLHELKLELNDNSDEEYDLCEDYDYSKNPPKERPFGIGETVIIRNPRRGQAKSGTLIKIHKSGRGTVLTRDNKGYEVKIVRLLSNLKRPEEE